MQQKYSQDSADITMSCKQKLVKLNKDNKIEIYQYVFSQANRQTVSNMYSCNMYS